MKIPSIYTKETLDQIVFDLASLRLSYNSNDGIGFKKKLLSKLSNRSGSVFLEVLENVPLEDVPAMLNEFEKFLSSIKVITLTLAFSPRRDFVQYIHDRVSNFVPDAFVLDIIVDSSVIGGFSIEFSGKFFDLTLSQDLAKRDLFTELRSCSP